MGVAVETIVGVGREVEVEVEVGLAGWPVLQPAAGRSKKRIRLQEASACVVRGNARKSGR